MGLLCVLNNIMKEKSKNPLPPLPQKKAEDLLRVFGEAIGSEKYSKALQQHQKAKKKYTFSIAQNSRLATLYDHAATKTHHSKLKGEYLQLADELYREILEENPFDASALRGIGKINEMLGDKKLADIFFNKAFAALKKAPQSSRGALGIGGFFDDRGDSRSAEKWFLREFDLLQDFGSAMNLFLFYYSKGINKETKRTAQLTERLMKEEFKKPQYRLFDMKHNDFFISLRQKIKAVKKGSFVSSPSCKSR